MVALFVYVRNDYREPLDGRGRGLFGRAPEITFYCQDPARPLAHLEEGTYGFNLRIRGLQRES
jgi:hypothetical protein